MKLSAKLLLAIILALNLSLAQAETYVQVNGISLHDRHGYNGFNLGMGLEESLSQKWTIAGGWYINSEHQGSIYAYGRYAFYKKNSWDVGVLMGAVTGYNRAQILPIIFPEICYT